MPLPKSVAVAVALIAWAAVPFPGVFAVVLLALWPRKARAAKEPAADTTEEPSAP